MAEVLSQLPPVALSVIAFMLFVDLMLIFFLSYRFQRQMLDVRNELGVANNNIAHLREQNAQFAGQNTDLQSKLTECNGHYAHRYAEFEQLYERQSRRQWFDCVKGSRFRSRSEIGVRIFAPLLRFLGYSDKAFVLDLPVRLIGGRGLPATSVNFVVYEKTLDRGDLPLFLLESVHPDQALIDPIKEEIFWKAHSIGVQKLAMTDGQEFVLYNRIALDKPILSFRLTEMSERTWDELQRELGPNAFQFLSS